MLLKSEIIWTRIGQVIRLWNDIHFSEIPLKTPGIVKQISTLSAFTKFWIYSL